MTVKLGMFTMPFHHPDRDYATILEEDQEAIVLAGRLHRGLRGRALLVMERAQTGPFGTLLMGGHDWDQPAPWRRTMELLATRVMPPFSKHAGAARP